MRARPELSLLFALLALGCAGKKPHYKEYRAVKRVDLHVPPIRPEMLRLEGRFALRDFRRESGLDSAADPRPALAALFNKEFKHIYVKWDRKFQVVDTSAPPPESYAVVLDTLIDTGTVLEERLRLTAPILGAGEGSSVPGPRYVLAMDSVCYSVSARMVNHGPVGVGSGPGPGLGPGAMPGMFFAIPVKIPIFTARSSYIIWDREKRRPVAFGQVEVEKEIGKKAKSLPWRQTTRELGYQVLRKTPFFDYKADTLMFDIGRPYGN